MNPTDRDRLMADLQRTRDQNAYDRGHVKRLGVLVCVCRVPAAAPHVDAGMCQVCKRKPIALMTVQP